MDPNNDCGQSLLKLAAAGSSILAELLRLSNHIPDVFIFESSKQQMGDVRESMEAQQIVDPEPPKGKKDKKAPKVDKKSVSAVNDQAQKLLEAQLREDTLRLQQYEQRKYE